MLMLPLLTLFVRLMSFGPQGQTPPAPPSAAAPMTTPPAVADASPPFLVLRVTDDVRRLANEFAARPVTAIPLDPDGVHGVAFDTFALAVVEARAHVPAPAGPAQARTLIVAFPLECAGRSVAPRAVEITAPAGVPAPGVVRLAALAADLPNLAMPAGAIGAILGTSTLPPRSAIRIAYDGAACPGTSSEVTLPVETTGMPLQVSRRVDVDTLPPGAAAMKAATVHVHGLIGPDGALRDLIAIDGPPALEAAALRAAGEWRFHAPSVNGAFTPVGVTVPILLTADGTLPHGRALEGLLTAGGVTKTASSGEVGVTNDTPGLTDATSACPIARDVTYAVTIENPVRIGGAGAVGGDARIPTYLHALRGPEGESLRYRRLGSLPGVTSRGDLDVFEVTFAGRDTPLRLYLDTNVFAAPQAPQGLACGRPIGLTAPLFRAPR